MKTLTSVGRSRHDDDSFRTIAPTAFVGRFVDDRAFELGVERQPFFAQVRRNVSFRQCLAQQRVSDGEDFAGHEHVDMSVARRPAAIVLWSSHQRRPEIRLLRLDYLAFGVDEESFQPGMGEQFGIKKTVYSP